MRFIPSCRAHLDVGEDGSRTDHGPYEPQFYRPPGYQVHVETFIPLKVDTCGTMRTRGEKQAVEVMTRDDGIRKVLPGPCHAVVLGSGASIASTDHNPEPGGWKLPSMDNFIDVVGLGDILERAPVDITETDFEQVYSKLYELDPQSALLREIEACVRDYFQRLTLPQTPTIYDYLMLALRPKDLIATFNWDPFLYEAFCRNSEAEDRPRISFLHGCVSIGFSEEDGKAGPAGMFSKATGARFKPSQLLFPVTHKNYQDRFIRREWERLERALKTSKRLTIFGFGAPSTDVEAVKLMSCAWGDPEQRSLEQVEIIDIAPEEELEEKWKKFIYPGHSDYCASYFDSILAQFPRRTGERFMHQFLPASPAEALQEANPVPQRFDTLEQMWKWHRPLLQAEEEDRHKESGS